MAKSPIHGPSDTPWHIDYVLMDPKDTRRDKRRCIYFKSTAQEYNYCTCKHGTCWGSTHCREYRETFPKQELQEQQEERTEVKQYAQELATQASSERRSIVEDGDTVYLSDTKTREEFTITINLHSEKELAKIVPMLVGKHSGDRVSCNNITYRITSIKKADTSVSNTNTDIGKTTSSANTSSIRISHTSGVGTVIGKISSPGKMTVYRLQGVWTHCPADGKILVNTLLECRTKNGRTRQIYFRYCATCRRYFTDEKVPTASINLSLFDLVVMPFRR